MDRLRGRRHRRRRMIRRWLQRSAIRKTSRSSLVRFDVAFLKRPRWNGAPVAAEAAAATIGQDSLMIWQLVSCIRTRS